MDNKEIYSKYEFYNWVNRKGLIEMEQYLIQNYIENKGRLIEAGCGSGRISCYIKKYILKSILSVLILLKK